LARYVILGHGTFNPESGSFPPRPDTTLQFFSDTGQALTLLRGTIQTWLAWWDQLKDQGYPIQPKGVTYNLTVYPDSTDEYRDSAKTAYLGEASVVCIDSGQT
jgi:hypothetical protein